MAGVARRAGRQRRKADSRPCSHRRDLQCCDDSARIRYLLASNRTLLAWIRTWIAFAGLGFVVAKFGFVLAQSGRTEDRIRFSGLLGTFLVLVGLLFTVRGYVQHHSLLSRRTSVRRTCATPMAWRDSGLMLHPGMRALANLPWRHHLALPGTRPPAG